MGIREKFLTEKVVQHGNGLLREEITVLSQSVFKKHLETDIYSLTFTLLCVE